GLLYYLFYLGRRVQVRGDGWVRQLRADELNAQERHAQDPRQPRKCPPRSHDFTLPPQDFVFSRPPRLPSRRSTLPGFAGHPFHCFAFTGRSKCRLLVPTCATTPPLCWACYVLAGFTGISAGRQSSLSAFPPRPNGLYSSERQT